MESGVTRYAYDALDRLTSITDARKNETRFTWDSLGRLEDSCDPDRGCTFFTWNDDATLATETTANKTVLQISYDNVGRPALQQSLDAGGDATRQVRWTWDIASSLGGSPGASRGRITLVEDTSKAARMVSMYHYDPLGRVDLERNCIDQACFDLGTGFDRAGRVGKVIYPSANGQLNSSSPTVDYIYNDRGLLDSLPGFVDRFVHDALGQTTEITYANGIVESRPHDRQRGWSEGVSVSRSRRGTTLLDQVVLRDPVGRVRDERLTDSQGARHEIYTHDDLGRLTLVTSSDPARNRTFTYDILGNLTRHSLLGDVEYRDSSHVHAMTHTQSGERYKYDRGGQLLSSNQLDLAWSDEGRPARITDLATGEISRYAYDVSGQRVRAEVGGRVTLSPHRLVQIEPGGAIKPWVWAEGRPLAYLENAGPRFLHADALGSVRLVTDSNGTVENEYDYGSWGEEVRATGTGGSEYRYAESRHDSSTGLAYMNARYYDPNSTRFISADPIIPDLYAPQTLNRYAYALNDPVSLTDPSGLCVTYYDENGKGGVDCTEPKRDPATGGGPPPFDAEAAERAWRREQGEQLRDEVRQSRELGPLRLPAAESGLPGLAQGVIVAQQPIAGGGGAPGSDPVHSSGSNRPIELADVTGSNLATPLTPVIPLLAMAAAPPPLPPTLLSRVLQGVRKLGIVARAIGSIFIPDPVVMPPKPTPPSVVRSAPGWGPGPGPGSGSPVFLWFFVTETLYMEGGPFRHPSPYGEIRLY